MTKKEQMLARIEIAHEIYEKIKEIPVNQRHVVFGLVEQFNQDDWEKFHAENRPVGYGDAKCANTVAPY